MVGVALLDLSTGEFSAAGIRRPRRDAGAGRRARRPRRARFSCRRHDDGRGRAIPLVAASGLPTTTIDAWAFELDSARRTLLDQLRAGSLRASGSTATRPRWRPPGALVHHMRSTQKVDLAHVRSIAYRQRADALLIDPTTVKHLEILEGSEGGRDGSLLGELDCTVTSVGSRLLRSWLLRPLVALEPIRDRLDAVEELAFRTTERGKFRDAIKAVQDLGAPRGARRAGHGGAARSGRPQALARRRPARAHACSPSCGRRSSCSLLSGARRPARRPRRDRGDARRRAAGARRATAASPATASTASSTSCARSADPASRSSPRWKSASASRTGIASLKVRYNRVFGVLHRDLEVEPARGAARLPSQADHRRRRALHHAGAEGIRREGARRRRAHPRARARHLRAAADRGRRRGAADPGDGARAGDARRPGGARRGRRRSTTTPSRTCTTATSSRSSTRRHPVVERRTASGDAFVPNDITLNAGTCQLIILTGPNMGGKSTYLRQTALLCLMAQAGSFVPARSAKVPLVDRIYARVGASDNIARGHSTFMVEMQETANILHTATSRSLVVLDEIGRGTATFDGLSIALGGRRVPGDQRQGAAEDALRHALSRAHRPRRRDPGRGELPRRGARVEGRHHLPAQDRAGPIRPQLRHPGRAAGRAAAPGDRAGPRNPDRARARRAHPRRPPVGQRDRSDPQRQLGLFQMPAADDGLRGSWPRSTSTT